MTSSPFTRRDTLRTVALSTATLALGGERLRATTESRSSRQATGIKIGEVTSDSAIVWMRLTERSERVRFGRLTFDANRKGEIYSVEDSADISRLEGACPGMPGRVRVRYGTREDLVDAQATEWASVEASTDFARQFRLDGLRPATAYFLSAETAGADDEPPHAPLSGSFRTAPAFDEVAPVTFSVITCEKIADMDPEDSGSSRLCERSVPTFTA